MAAVIKAAQGVLQLAMKDLDSGTPSHGCTYISKAQNIRDFGFN